MLLYSHEFDIVSNQLNGQKAFLAKLSPEEKVKEDLVDRHLKLKQVSFTNNLLCNIKHIQKKLLQKISVTKNDLKMVEEKVERPVGTNSIFKKETNLEQVWNFFSLKCSFHYCQG